MSLNTDLKVLVSAQQTPVLAQRHIAEPLIGMPLDQVQLNGQTTVANEKNVAEEKFSTVQQNQMQVAAALSPGAPTALVAVAAAADPQKLPPKKSFYDYWDQATQSIESAVSGLGRKWFQWRNPNVDAPANIKRAAKAKLRELGTSAYLNTNPAALIPLLRKLQLDPVEFYTARACWQGVTNKRRHMLSSVISQFPSLPAGQKSWQKAVEAARGQGKEFTKTDEYFIGYFFENRRALKTLFRATLNQWQGDRIVCYRGRTVGPKGVDEEPLECYSLSPRVSNGFGTTMKRHRVKLSEVWSAFTVLQNANHGEYELTVYSAGGRRAGKVIQPADSDGEQVRFELCYSSNTFTRQLGL